MIGKFEVSKSSNDTFMFNLRADNGLVILSSHAHANKASVMQCIESVRRNAPIDARFERLTSVHGEPCFNLKSSTGQVIGHSQVYSSVSAMENGIASVGRNAPNAVLVDMAPEPRRVTAR